MSLVKEVKEGGLYMLLADLVGQIWQDDLMEEGSSSLEEMVTELTGISD